MYLRVAEIEEVQVDHVLDNELINQIKTVDMYKTSFKALTLYTIRPKRYYKNRKLMQWLYDGIHGINSSGPRYQYPFLTNFNKFYEFIKNDGIITLSFQDDKLIGFNMSMLKKLNARVSIMIAGITVMKKHTLGFSPFLISNQNYTTFCFLDCLRRKRALYVSTLVNDGASLEAIKAQTGSTCYPHFSTKLNYNKRKLYTSLVELSFNSYVKDNFPEAKLCKNSFIVQSKKTIMGFYDSFSKMKHGIDCSNSVFIKSWLNDFSSEDILFVGKILSLPVLRFHISRLF